MAPARGLLKLSESSPAPLPEPSSASSRQPPPLLGLAPSSSYHHPLSYSQAPPPLSSILILTLFFPFSSFSPHPSPSQPTLLYPPHQPEPLPQPLQLLLSPLRHHNRKPSLYLPLDPWVLFIFLSSSSATTISLSHCAAPAHSSIHSLVCSLNRHSVRPCRLYASGTERVRSHPALGSMSWRGDRPVDKTQGCTWGCRDMKEGETRTQSGASPSGSWLIYSLDFTRPYCATGLTLGIGTQRGIRHNHTCEEYRFCAHLCAGPCWGSGGLAPGPDLGEVTVQCGRWTCHQTVTSQSTPGYDGGSPGIVVKPGMAEPQGVEESGVRNRCLVRENFREEET